MLDNLKPNYVLAQEVAKNGEWIVTAGWDNTAKIWDTQTGKEIFTLTGHDGKVDSAAYSPDGRQVVTASRDYTAKVWHANIGNELMTLKGHFAAATYSADGQRIVTAN